MSQYSQELKKLAEWLKRETKITYVALNSEPSTNQGRVSARLVFNGDAKSEIGNGQYRDLSVILRLEGPSDRWFEVVDTLQNIQNNLERERDYDLRYSESENPDGIQVEGEDFRVDLSITLSVKTGNAA